MNGEERGLVAKMIQMAVRKVLEQSDDRELVDLLQAVTPPFRAAMNREYYKKIEREQQDKGIPEVSTQRIQEELREKLAYRS